jgi:hypothetical protein
MSMRGIGSDGGQELEGVWIGVGGAVRLSGSRGWTGSRALGICPSQDNPTLPPPHAHGSYHAFSHGAHSHIAGTVRGHCLRREQCPPPPPPPPLLPSEACVDCARDGEEAPAAWRCSEPKCGGQRAVCDIHAALHRTRGHGVAVLTSDSGPSLDTMLGVTHCTKPGHLGKACTHPSRAVYAPEPLLVGHARSARASAPPRTSYV